MAQQRSTYRSLSTTTSMGMAMTVLVVGALWGSPGNVLVAARAPVSLLPDGFINLIVEFPSDIEAGIECLRNPQGFAKGPKIKESEVNEIQEIKEVLIDYKVVENIGKPLPEFKEWLKQYDNDVKFADVILALMKRVSYAAKCFKKVQDAAKNTSG